MAKRGNGWLGGATLFLAGMAAAGFGLTWLALATADMTSPAVGRLSGLPTAAGAVAALGWASWAR